VKPPRCGHGGRGSTVWHDEEEAYLTEELEPKDYSDKYSEESFWHKVGKFVSPVR